MRPPGRRCQRADLREGAGWWVGITLANTVLSKLGDGGTDDGKVCVYTSTKTDLVIDTAVSVL